MQIIVIVKGALSHFLENEAFSNGKAAGPFPFLLSVKTAQLQSENVWN